MNRATSPAQLAATAKRVRRAAKLNPTSFRDIIPTSHPGAIQARGETRRKDREERAQSFDHGSATAARLRHKSARKGKKRVPKKAFEKKPYNPVDHLHPRHMRQFAA